MIVRKFLNSQRNSKGLDRVGYVSFCLCTQDAPPVRIRYEFLFHTKQKPLTETEISKTFCPNKGISRKLIVIDYKIITIKLYKRGG